MQPRIAVDALAAALLGGILLAAPAAAHVIGPGSGRTGATVALLAALIGVITGGFAVARSGRAGTSRRNGRDGAIAALVLAVIGMVLAGLHLATSTGGIGTGNGRAGAILALVLGLIGMALGRLALARSKETRSHA